MGMLLDAAGLFTGPTRDWLLSGLGVTLACTGAAGGLATGVGVVLVAVRRKAVRG